MRRKQTHPFLPYLAECQSDSALHKLFKLLKAGFGDLFSLRLADRAVDGSQAPFLLTCDVHF